MYSKQSLEEIKVYTHFLSDNKRKLKENSTFFLLQQPLGYGIKPQHERIL